jgi:DNA-binding NarL/FixJ family response regulator
MDRSKVAAAAAELDRPITFVRPDALAGADVAGALVLVDLGRPGAVEAIASLRAAGGAARIVAFGSHVDRELLDAARAAGADDVLARSAFFSSLATVLAP